MAYRKKIFVSYDYDNDRHYKNLLMAWDANKLFDIYINDHSADISINSYNANSIKSVISRYINEATYFLVIVGRNTDKGSWVKWEIEKAKELGKRIVAVKTERDNPTPLGLYGVGASWAMSFTYEAIIRAIDNA